MPTFKHAWWHSLSEECPITLEPLSTLPYPPFTLKRGDKCFYFDGLALASYCVAQGVFQNPLTREELTFVDCHRLDDHLETYCCYQGELDIVGGRTRRLFVAEAFALRSSVRVKLSHQDEHRSRMLQNEAAAALAGLFVYGNDRRLLREHRSSQNITEPSSSRVGTREREDDGLLQSWGFDLNRTVADTATMGSGTGWMIVDDDEAAENAVQREAYQAVQSAFPPLIDGGNNSTQHPNRTPPQLTVDEQLLECIRQLGIQEYVAQAQREKNIELGRKKLLEAAYQRRQERKRRNQEHQQERAHLQIKRQQEEEEQRKAREEIEAWRDEYWEKLREHSDVQLAKAKALSGKGALEEVGTSSIEQTAPKSSNLDHPSSIATAAPDEQEAEAKKKAKAAAKRKRAKERKKIQRAEANDKLQKETAKKELEAQRSQAALKCNTCGIGILDSGFERLGRKFCSPKCARAAS